MSRPKPLVDLVADAVNVLDKRVEGAEDKLRNPQDDMYRAGGVPRALLSEEQSALRRMLPPIPHA
jgi:hypothetical protein